jgi:tetratricopeptide (TPR) repeat protein
MMTLGRSSCIRTMSGFRSPLDAYREDLSRVRGRKRLATGDEFWIILATGLRRVAQARDAARQVAARRLASVLATFAIEFGKEQDAATERVELADAAVARRAMAVADALAEYPDPEHATPLVRHVRDAAADAEEAGGIEIAREILTDVVELTAHAQPLDRGLVLVQLARIARTRGELDSAHDFLKAAGDLGRATGTRELEVREAGAEGVIACRRGNYPAARRLFETALAGASELELADIVGASHQGLMVVAALADELDTALHHGWLALSNARDQGAREAETLNNLAELCARAGYAAAALGGFATALARTTAPRVRIPALGGAATAAGRLGNTRVLDLVERAITREANEAFPYETSGAWLSLARAKRAVGDTVAGDAAAKKAADIAHAHGFFEISHYIEQDAQRAPVRLTATSLEVIRSLEDWSNNPSAELMLNISTDG